MPAPKPGPWLTMEEVGLPRSIGTNCDKYQRAVRGRWRSFEVALSGMLAHVCIASIQRTSPSPTTLMLRLNGSMMV